MYSLRKSSVLPGDELSYSEFPVKQCGWYRNLELFLALAGCGFGWMVVTTSHYAVYLIPQLLVTPYSEKIQNNCIPENPIVRLANRLRD